ncbi:hypothetical protein E2L06_00425 [Haloterrigena sp. H1]|uniref:hypothetical protein n=1 Tax=Haloterrigena sp. H1 TaxID=2552943 RepID=UPI00110D2D09|nr:hypothetical protein [Haloterrigena sp. H1]TMT85149.1 hypothetical protein E2L06_00425 [Haloterrigena sp. H1]
MRELRTCDFCDADAVGTFEIVPPELEPTEAEQRRIVCCPDCRDRLETLLEPLLARLGVDDSIGGGHPENGSVVATADGPAATRSRTASSNATVTDAAADERAAPDTSDRESAGDEPDSDPSDSDADAAEADPNSDEADSDATSLADGITLERNEQPDDSGAEPVDAADGAGAPPSSASPPRAYSKVIRLLRNREFPMQRRAVEELAAGAYDLESHEAEAIVEYAIEDGEFVENGGELRRP